MIEEKERKEKRQQVKVPPTGIKSRDFWGKRASSNNEHKKRKAHFSVMCSNRHTYKTDVKPPQHCPVCNVLVDRRGYVNEDAS